MHPRYDCWIKYVFDHPVTDQQWHFELDAPKFTVDDVEISTLVAETYDHAGTDLVNYSDAQVNQGLWYLSSNACSNYHMQIRDGESSVELKSRAIRAVYNLYRDCFANRCNETLGHTDEPGASELNPVCYMFWDITPWGYLTDLKFEKELSTAILDTLEKILLIEHRGCREGALHGLGEIAYRYETDVARIVDRFLDKVKIDDALRVYALRAREGCVL